MRRAIDYGLMIRAKTFASILLAIITATAHSQQAVPTSLAPGFNSIRESDLRARRRGPGRLVAPAAHNGVFVGSER